MKIRNRRYRLRAVKRSTGKKWRALWIWDGQFDLRNAFLCFRKKIRLASAPARCMARISADSRYALWINGAFVCRGPARCFPEHQSYDELDLAPFLRKGENIVAAQAHHFGQHTFQYIYTLGKGFILDARIEFAGGRAQELITDNTWKVCRDPARKRKVARASISHGYQEHFDARMELVGWRDADYDDSGWRNAYVEGAVGTEPWTGMEPRGIPFARERERAPVALLCPRTGKCAPGWRDPRNIAEILRAEPRAKSAKQLVSSASPAGPYKIPPTAKDRFISFALDMGVETLGFAEISVAGADGGEIIDLYFMEYLDKDGEFHVPDSQEHSRVAMADRLTCRPGDQSVKFWNLRGMRYALLVVRNAPKGLEIRRFRMIEALYPFEHRGAFACSEVRLNAIWRAARRTQECCAIDSYIDCPWREQNQWWGDACIQALVTYHAFGDPRLVRRGLRQGAQSQTKSGLLWGIFPTKWPFGILPDYSCAWVMSLRDYVLYTGDRATAMEMLPAMDKIFKWFKANSKSGLLRGNMPGLWVFLDWTPLDKSAYSTTFTLLHLLALRAGAQTAAWAGDADRAARLMKEAGRVAWAVRRKCVDQRKNLVYESVPADGGRARQLSQHAAALAILAGIVEGKAAVELARAQLLDSIADKRRDVVPASAFFSFYVLEALFETGFQGEALNYIGDRWGAMLDKGATTFWERFDSDTAGECWSRCHAWSAHPLYHLSRRLLGVKPVEPGFSRIEIAPAMPVNARGIVPTPRGDIRISMEVRDATGADSREIIVEIKMPRRTAGIFRLGGFARALRPGRTNFQIRERIKDV